MKRISLLTLMFITAAFFAACGGTSENKPAANAAPSNANANAAAKPVAAAPTKEALIALEKTGWDAWKSKDPKPLQDLMSDRYVGFGAAGRVDKAESIKSVTDPKVVVKSYSFSDEQMSTYGNDVAVLTFKATQDYTQADGKPGPKEVWSSSVYVREGDKWKNLMYLENPVVDPKAPPAKPAAPAPAKKDEAAKPEDTKPDALTETLMAVETKAWDAWKTRDAKAQDAVMAAGFMYVGAIGRYDRAGALKLWSEPKCTTLGYKFSDPKGVQVTPDFTLVTYKADVTGTCDGAPVPPHLWVASFDLKEGDAWKNAFYTDVSR